MSTLDSNDNIEIDDVLEILVDMKSKEKLRQKAKILHEQKYSISHSQDGKRHMTWVPDQSKPSGRRKIVKTTEAALLDELVTIYLDIIEKEDSKKQKTYPKKITFRELHPEWLEYQQLDRDAGTIKRYDNDWNTYYVNEELSKIVIDTPIEDLKSIKIKQWVYKMIEKHQMTAQKYYNMSTILRQGLAYAAMEDVGIIGASPYKVEVKRNDKKLKRAKKKDNETQVFNLQLLKDLIQLCWEDYEKHKGKFLTPLAILFMIESGLRVGELLGLYWTDINSDEVIVSRQYGRIYKDGVLGYGIKDYTKSEAGNRNVPLTEVAITVLQEIKKYYLRTGGMDERIFVDVGYSATRNKLYRYCDKLSTTRKSNHKLRKTFVSRLLNEGISINDVRSIVGHEDEKTTLRCYTFGLETAEELKTHVKQALAL